jgi:hypothetical protein
MIPPRPPPLILIVALPHPDRRATVHGSVGTIEAVKRRDDARESATVHATAAVQRWCDDPVYFGDDGKPIALHEWGPAPLVEALLLRAAAKGDPALIKDLLRDRTVTVERDGRWSYATLGSAPRPGGSSGNVYTNALSPTSLVAPLPPGASRAVSHLSNGSSADRIC